MSDILESLAATIAARKGSDPEASYTSSLLAQGTAKCAEKFGEEAVEAIVAAAMNDQNGLRSEAADVLFHLLVLLASSDVSLESVLEELASRQGVSGHLEKSLRKK